MRTGIFLLEYELGRGFDLKCGSDSFVIVLDFEGTLGKTEARQMIGRSSRT